jgi:hypothetical protein
MKLLSLSVCLYLTLCCSAFASEPNSTDVSTRTEEYDLKMCQQRHAQNCINVMCANVQIRSATCTTKCNDEAVAKCLEVKK